MPSLSQSGTQEDDRPLPVKQWNRSHATKRLGEEIFRAKGDPEYRFSVVLVELEGLSDSGDRIGYAAAGEDVWRRAMTFLSKDLAPQDMCCRLSGDEFLLIASGQGEQEVRALVDRLRKRWQPAAGTREAEVQLNFGIAAYPTHGGQIENLLCAADETLHADRLRNELIRTSEARRAVLITTSH